MESSLDGALAESHPIFSEDPTALQIILYYHDVTLITSCATRVKFE